MNTIGILLSRNNFIKKDIVAVLNSFFTKLKKTVLYEVDDIKNNADMIIVLGGDGSMLSAVREFVDDDIPILGINLGRLGFLADVSFKQMTSVLTSIMAGDFIVEKRALLACFLEEDKQQTFKGLAFNDVVLRRQQDEKIIEFNTYIDEQLLQTQRADGLIVNTATGSTAYALSSGGPIVHPLVNAISLVPICPHTFSNRPIVVSDKVTVAIQLCEKNSVAAVNLDAQFNFLINQNQKVIVKQYQQKVRLIHPLDYDYFEILRSKLKWGGYAESKQ